MRTLLVLGALSLAACASQPKADKAPEDAPSESRSLPSRDVMMTPSPVILEEIVTAAGRTTTVERVKDFLPFIDLAMNPDAASADYGLPLEDYYTRIRIETLNPKATDMAGTASGEYTQREPDRDYRKESRGWFSRMMSSKTVNRTLMVEFDLSKPSVTSTKALFSASFTSNNQDGESWSTDQSLALYATPWFRVSSNSTMTTKLRMQLADQRENYGASANVLGTLTEAATLLSPTAPLVTYFSAPAMTKASNFLDSSVSTLFGRAITEQSTGTMALKTWSGEPLLVVYAAMPDARDIRKTKNRDMLGGWAIYLEEPIVSMFTSATQDSEDGYEDRPDYADTNGSDILAFEMAQNKTIYSYIFVDLGMADRISELNESADAGLARQICNRIDRGLTEFGGLNAWDAAAGVYAAATSDMMNQAAQDVMTKPETCRAMKRYDDLHWLNRERPMPIVDPLPAADTDTSRTF